LLSDVIGVVKSAKDVRVIVSKTTNKEFKMREIQMVDSTNAEVYDCVFAFNV
jgi:replication factor A1